MGNGIFQKIKWLFIVWLARRLPDCKPMTQMLGESLDREVSWRDKIVIRLHLFTCEACARYLEQISFLKEALHRHGECEQEASEFSVATLHAESKARIKAALRNQLGLAI